MKLLNLLFIILLAVAFGACGGTATKQTKDDAKDASKTEKKDDKKKDDAKPTESEKTADTPKAAVENFVAAVKAKDENAIRATLAEDTIKAFDMMAKQRKVSFYEVLMEGDDDEMNKMPDIKDVKIDGDKATAEVKAKDDKAWTKLNFAKEGGSWKLALISKEQMEEMSKKMDEVKKLQDAADKLDVDKKSENKKSVK